MNGEARGRSGFPFVVVVLVVLRDLRVFDIIQGRLGDHLEPHDVELELLDIPVIEGNLLLHLLPPRHLHERLRVQIVLDGVPLGTDLLESGPEDFQLAGSPGFCFLQIGGLSGPSLRIRADIDPGGGGRTGCRPPDIGRRGACLRGCLGRCRFLACLRCFDADIDKERAGRSREGDHDARTFQDVGDRVALAVHHGGDGGIDGHSHLLELGPRRAGHHVGQLAHGIEDVPRHLVMFLAQHVGYDLTDAFFGEAQCQGPDGIARDPDDAGDIPGGRLILFQRGFPRNGIQKGHLFQDLQCAVQEGVDVFDVHVRCFGSCCGIENDCTRTPRCLLRGTRAK